ncbi:MAG TPA: Ig-like domain-containing protein [Thermoanaerobaculia bacterium]|nr:Ig-like domain-containing protein [Thermoanaerobaculia bacterium]
MTWRAVVSGGSGNFTFSWTGSDGLTGDSQLATKTYATEGFKLARVTVSDTANGDAVTSPDCPSHVIPVSFPEPPSVNPVLWVPNDVDPAHLVPQVERAWRAVQAAFFDQYGKTFRMNPLTTIVSPDTEIDICGGDCTEISGGNARLMAQAWQEAQAAITDVVPYTRAIQVLAWGAGGFAGSFGWDHPLGGVGDWALGSIAGVPIPPITADIHEGFAKGMGTYSGSVSTLAHELNHAIGWDDPHDFSLSEPPNDYERQFSVTGPWLTETPADVTDPVVSFSAPADGAFLSGTVTVSANASDETSLDAVVFLVDDQFMTADHASPFSFEFDTTQVGFGPHRLEAIAYDNAGNITTVTLAVTVQNQVAESSCSETFPTGVFHACFFDGANLDGPYLGTLLDTPFPVPSANLGIGINHAGFGEVAFGQSDTVSGVWRGILDFPPGNYILSFYSDDGLRVNVNGLQILDEWRDQVAHFEKVVALEGPTSIQIEWFQNGGSYGLVFRWRPTAQRPQPPVTMVSAVPASVVVKAGTLKRGDAGSLASEDDDHLTIKSTKTGAHTRITSWIGRFTGVPADLQDLRVAYTGRNSQTCLQAVEIWRPTTSTWVTLDSRRVGTTEVPIKGLIPPGPDPDFVSNGNLLVRVTCQKDGGNFTAHADLLRLDYLSPGGP